MVGQPGFELFGPWDDGEAVRTAIIEAGQEFGVKLSGSRTYCLKGRLALLETKLMAWALEKIAAANFTPITVPAIAREQAFLNQGQFPGHVEETYALPNDELYLAGITFMKYEAISGIRTDREFELYGDAAMGH